ncbi:protein SPMIP1 [Cydia strobilella]|uniref:protein SPMIP1 n=1 Tax=Cydia strobilella TaxID=1100964 RepID=UPI003007A1F9
MPFDTTDPKVINFLLECYEKEAQARLAWREKHSHMFQKAATFQKELKNYTHADIDYALAAAGMAATIRDHIEAARHRLTSSKVIVPKRDEYESALRNMFPVEPEHESIRIKEGRKAYLKKRYELSPEERYVFPETSNWMYGWRMKDSEMKVVATRHPRLGLMTSALYSNVGPQPDPSYYGNPACAITFCSRFT